MSIDPRPTLIALEVSLIARFKVTTRQIPVLLIRDHEVTVWASSLEGASNYNRDSLVHFSIHGDCS